ncbi:MAG TPA: tripartite tricarboxylate transporter substrate binding protein [Alphaproteobacteria bacterium]|nr:tripartite tricarboxylate transporter substrate binding protein [Alphaproteobacteria bacterium]
MLIVTLKRLALSLVLLGWLGAGAHAQTDYPNKPVRLIVPFAAGGGGDNLARSVSQAASEALGQQIIIENRAGAGGNIGAAAAAKTVPDGYTILYGTNGTHAINHALYANPGFDPIKDFTPVARLTRIGMVVVVNPDVPAKSVPELLAHLKKNPGKISFGSAGNGTSSHIAGEMFKMMTGTDILHVPYRGNGPAMIDLVGGRIEMMIDVMPSAYPHAEAGKIRALAVTTKTPVAAAPNLPTLDSSGVQGFELSAWDGIWAPAGTPRPIVDKLNAAFNKALAHPAVKERLFKIGAEPVPGTPDDLGKFVASELPKWAEVVKRSGAKVE